MTTVLQAKQIMGRNFFGIEDAIRHFGLIPSNDEITALAEVPFSEATLKSCKDSHILVATPSISIVGIRNKARPPGNPFTNWLSPSSRMELFEGETWYKNRAFAVDGGTPEWHLVRKTPVANSPSKTWDEQQALLASNEETPKARVMVYTIIGHFLKTSLSAGASADKGERLFEKIYVRCVDEAPSGEQVIVGSFSRSYGLVINARDSDNRDFLLGLASARKREI